MLRVVTFSWNIQFAGAWFAVLMSFHLYHHACLSLKSTVKSYAEMCSIWYFMPVSASPAAVSGVAVLCTMLRIIHLLNLPLKNRLILLQVRVLLLDTILGDDEHLQTITDLNMPLRRAGERVLDQALHSLSVQCHGRPHNLLQTRA